MSKIGPDTLFVLDATGYVYRSYFAIRNMSNSRGEATNALYGFVRSVQKIIKDFGPKRIVAVFDGPNGAAPRKAIYPDYKAHRDATPDDLPPQRELAQRFCEALGIPQLTIAGVEADDVMGSIATWAKDKGESVALCTSDKDLVQLINGQVCILQTHKNNLVIDTEEAKNIYGITPEQMIDYLALVGDTADNVPGVPGVGPKTASKMLQQFGTLEELLAHPDQLSSKKQQEKIESNSDAALMSQRLVTIDCAVDIPHDLDFYSLKETNWSALREIYSQAEFRTLLKELDEIEPADEASQKPIAPAVELNYKIVDNADELAALIERLHTVSSLCIDTESSSLKQLQAELVGVGFCEKPGEAWYVPTNGQLGREAVLAALKPLLSNKNVAFYGHNLKYDLHILANHGLRVANVGFDTMLASYLLSAHLRHHSLDALSEQHFDKTKTPISDLIGKGKKQKSMLDVPIEQVGPYCCEDVDYTCRLKGELEQQLKERSLGKLFYELELPVLKVLFQMERNGIYVDRHVLGDKARVLRERLEEIEQEIYTLAGETFNINSPKQVGEVLFEKLGLPASKKTATGYSTSADVLEGLAGQHPIAGQILAYRALEKLRSTYVEALPEYIDPNTDRIHCTFAQSMTATGRLSSRDPNLQNIPVRSAEGREIRAAFRPQKEGWSFLAADYSQIELRLVAHFSRDPRLTEAFKEGLDIHTYTASLVFDVPLKEVTKEQRYHAKAVNFGLIYGQQAFGLSKELGIPVKEAGAFIKTYFERYPKVQSYLEESKKLAHDQGKAVTMMGRERILPEINNRNPVVRAQAERLAVNTPLQGTQADLIKKAMIEVEAQLRKQGKLAYMVLQIHDELILEVPDHELIDVEHIVRQAMEKVTKLRVPLIVNVSVGKTWEEC